MLQSFDDLFARFGGVREFAEAIDLKYSTVVAFKTRGSIPMEHWKKIESRPSKPCAGWWLTLS